MPLETSSYIEGLTEAWPLGGDPVNKGDDHLRLLKHILKQTFPGIASNGFSKAITATEDELNYLGGLTSNAQGQLNALDARITTLEGVLIATPGTVMTFYQSAAPLGWTKVVTHNDYMMRIVSGTGGASAGSDSPILNNKIPTHNHTASNTTTSTAHTHTFSDTSTNNNVSHTHTFSDTSTTAGDHYHISGITHSDVIPDEYGTIIRTAVKGAKFSDQNQATAAKTDTTGSHTHDISGTTSEVSANHTHNVSGTTSAVSANSTHNHTITVNNNAGSNWTPKYMNFIIASKD